LTGITAYVNGRFLPLGEAAVGIEDRGYQFGDGIYEVVRVYGGTPFKMREHLDRLRRSARAIELDLPDLDRLTEDALELLKRNGLRECSLYIQVTRGVCPRKHTVPRGIAPTVVMTAREVAGFPAEYRSRGVKLITVPDDRWARCYIKTTNLLPNVLARSKAERAGAYEAVFVRDGFVMECSSSNLFIVESGALVTPPLTNYILAGVTRATVIQLAEELGIEVREEAVSLERLYRSDEVFVTGTVTEIVPAVDIDGTTVGTGKPGPVFSLLYRGYTGLTAGAGDA
jgi:D-alanine transaminase